MTALRLRNNDQANVKNQLFLIDSLTFHLQPCVADEAVVRQQRGCRLGLEQHSYDVISKSGKHGPGKSNLQASLIKCEAYNVKQLVIVVKTCFL